MPAICSANVLEAELQGILTDPTKGSHIHAMGKMESFISETPLSLIGDQVGGHVMTEGDHKYLGAPTEIPFVLLPSTAIHFARVRYCPVCF